jgi:hypothetical protein
MDAAAARRPAPPCGEAHRFRVRRGAPGVKYLRSGSPEMRARGQCRRQRLETASEGGAQVRGERRTKSPPAQGGRGEACRSPGGERRDGQLARAVDGVNSGPSSRAAEGQVNPHRVARGALREGDPALDRSTVWGLERAAAIRRRIAARNRELYFPIRDRKVPAARRSSDTEK